MYYYGDYDDVVEGEVVDRHTGEDARGSQTSRRPEGSGGGRGKRQRSGSRNSCAGKRLNRRWETGTYHS
jgi:hypothetical protein